MQLLRLSEVQTRPEDRVFRHSPLSGIIFLVVLVGGAAWIAEYTHTQAKTTAGYYLAAGLAFIGLCAIGFIRAAFRSSSWLVRMNASGILVHFRSYLNYRLPEEDATVVFLSFSEIRSARLIKARVDSRDMQGKSQTQYLRFVELELTGDTKPLEQALAAEMGEQAPMLKHWYGSGSTLYRDYPVQMETRPFLQIQWSAKPGAPEFLSRVQRFTTVLDTVHVVNDFTRLQNLSREEQEKKLRELDARGQTIAAIYTARRLYGCGLTEAKEMVDKLRSEPRSNSMSA